MGKKKLNLVGQRFGKLTVIRESSTKKWKRSITAWECICDCGGTYIGTTMKLRAGELGSCGCLRKKRNKKYRYLLSTYSAMISRCNNPETKGFHNYGGRGIKVCDEWINSFDVFCQDVGDRPKCTSLDRIDNNGNYCKENCRWASREEQARNTRCNVYIEFDGENKLVIDWAKELGVPHNTISSRVQKNLSPEDCLFGNDPITGVYHEKKNKRYRASGRIGGKLFVAHFSTRMSAIEARLNWEKDNE